MHVALGRTSFVEKSDISSDSSGPSVNSEELDKTVSVTGFLDRASIPLFNFPCLYSNLY